jgi:hypothetical protein
LKETCLEMANSKGVRKRPNQNQNPNWELELHATTVHTTTLSQFTSCMYAFQILLFGIRRWELILYSLIFARLRINAFWPPDEDQNPARVTEERQDRSSAIAGIGIHFSSRVISNRLIGHFLPLVADLKVDGGGDGFKNKVIK